MFIRTKNKTKKFSISIISLFAILGTTTLFAQQLPIFTQYREMIGVINPAAPSSDYLIYEDIDLTVGASYRNQWVGLEGSPTTLLAHASGVWEQRAVNFLPGLSIINDQVGKTSTTGAYLRLGGILSGEPKEYGISLGIHGGIVQYRVNLTGVNQVNIGVRLNDLVLNQIYPDVGAGIFGYKEVDRNMFYGGLSIPQLLKPDLAFKTDNNTYQLKLIPHLYGVIGYIIKGNDDKFLEISSWIKYVKNTPIHADLNMRWQIAVPFWLGGGMSTSKIGHLEAGVVLGGTDYGSYLFKIGVGIGFSFSKLNPYYGASQEINITYSLAN